MMQSEEEVYKQEEDPPDALENQVARGTANDEEITIEEKSLFECGSADDRENSFQNLLMELKKETVKKEQVEELADLDVTVYDQGELERGIIEQLESVLEAEEERNRKKRENKELPEKLRAINRKKKKDGEEDKSKGLDLENVEEEISAVSTENVLKSVEVNEDEEKVKLGEMTPFGTTLDSVTRFRSDSEANEEEDPPDVNSDSDPEFIPEKDIPKKKPDRKNKKRSKKIDFQDPGTDDSAWESSDDDGKKGKKSLTRKKVRSSAVDDGDLTQFNERIADWKELIGKSKEEELKGYEEFEGGYRIPSKIWKKLFTYQRVGVRWLWELYLQKCGGILGDEMGLGKTIQMIAFLAGIAYSNLFDKTLGIRGLGPVIIVVPTTVMHQWVKEFHTWWPSFRVAVLHESGSHTGGRQTLIRAMVNHKGVLITSYSGIVQYKEELLKYNWHFVILDEGHKIRNPDAQATLAVKQFRTPYRIILSGSPIQNNLKELWSLFDFVFPGKLGTLPVFMQQFSVPITIGGYVNASKLEVAAAYKCACILRDTINPYLLRRQKADVKKHLTLPSKSEQVLFCKLTPEQRELYKTYIDGGEIKNILEGRGQAFVGLINLRKICNHPDLFPGYNGQFRDVSWESETRECDWKRSGKMVVVESLLRIWKKQGHRVLLFSQSKQMLDLFEKFVRSYEYRYLRLDGSTSIGARQPLIDKFNNDSSIFVFLLTTRVGGLGVNLTGANRVIIYDPDWNPMTDVQARERAWRIGQTKDVTIFRLLTSGTIEEKIYHRQIFKQFLTNKVLKDPKQRRFFKSNDLCELFTLQDGDNAGTETGAIFAGTGSEILRQRKKKRKQEPATEEPFVPPKRKKAKKIDGEVIENLEKKSTFRPPGEDDLKEKSEEKQNEYVLERLFKKSGLQSVIKHDVVMESSAPDFELVEAEAEKVAKEAALSLKASRRECFPAFAGIPTWTGSHGAKKPRFGTKKNTKLLGLQTPAPSNIVVLKQKEKKVSDKENNWDFSSMFMSEEPPKKKKKKKQVENGSSSSATKTGDSKPLTSNEILARIRDRNRLIGTIDDLPQPDSERPRFRRPDPDIVEPEENLPVLQEGDSRLELLREIRNFLLFGASNPGEALTEELLAEFRDKLPEDSNAALFRALLREICEFKKEGGKGTWILLPDFR